jgi:transposase
MTEKASGKRNFDELERRRMKAVKLFQQGLSQAEVARRLNVARESVRRWWNQFAAHGSGEALRKAERPGRKPRLTDAQLKQLRTMLRAGPTKSGFSDRSWTLKTIAEAIAARFGVDYHVRYVSWLLRNKLAWSLQRKVVAARVAKKRAQPKRKRAGRHPRSRKR